MVITQASRRRKQLYMLYIDGEEWAEVDARTWEESAYRVGMQVTLEDLDSLQTESRSRRAKEKAFYLLSLRDYSRADLAKKLTAQAGREVAEETAARMEELGFVQDEQYAFRLARDLRLRKHYPLRRTIQELQAKGIDRELAAEAADAVETDDAAQALELLRKKYYNRLNDEQGRQKATAALARYGFSYEAIRQAVRELSRDFEDNREITDEWR